MFSFIKNLVGVKVDGALNEGVRLLVEFDPKAATEAQMRSMEQHLDQLGRDLCQARAAYDKEAKEAHEIQGLYAQRLAAAEKLSAMFDAEADPARKAELEKSLTTLLATLESMRPDIEREQREADDAKNFLDLLETSYEDAGAKFKQARAQLDDAARKMKSAELEREMARRQEEQARTAAGLNRTVDGLSVALKAMDDTAAKKQGEAEAARRKAALLAPTKVEQDDHNIAAAMAAVSGKPAQPQSIAERLAALKK